MVYAVWLMTMESGIRFLTDYLSGDRNITNFSDERQNLYRAVNQFFKQRQRGVMRQLAAQVQAVLGAVDAAFLRLFDGVDHLLQILQPIAAVAYITNRHGVQHGGDAARHHQRVVAAHRRVGRPVNFRARGEEFIQIIGMQLNQPR